VPHGITLKQALALRVSNPGEYKRLSVISMGEHV